MEHAITSPLDVLPGFESLRAWDWARFMKWYADNRGLLDPHVRRAQGSEEHEYQDIATLWADVIAADGLDEWGRVALRGVTLVDWLPLAPGRYHTEQGRRARSVAKHFVGKWEDDQVTYDPYGKGFMVLGGLGCLRVASKTVGDEPLKFLAAASPLPDDDGDAPGRVLAHTGFVVALTPDLYTDEVKKAIRDRGGVVCNLVGEIRYWSSANGFPFEFATEVPRAYLRASEVWGIDPDPVVPGHAAVSAAVTFQGVYQENRGRYFTYKHFDPAIRGDLDECVHWLKRTYVGELYPGRVITDFDERVGHFEGASFPVRTLMDPDSGEPIPGEVTGRIPPRWWERDPLDVLLECSADDLDRLERRGLVDPRLLLARDRPAAERATRFREVVAGEFGPLDVEQALRSAFALLYGPPPAAPAV